MSMQIRLVSNLDVSKITSIINQVERFIIDNEFEKETVEYINKVLNFDKLKSTNLQEYVGTNYNAFATLRNDFISIRSQFDFLSKKDFNLKIKDYSEKIEELKNTKDVELDKIYDLLSTIDDITLKEEILIEYNKHKNVYKDNFDEKVIIAKAMKKINQEDTAELERIKTNNAAKVESKIQKDTLKEVYRILSKVGFKVVKEVKKDNDYSILAKRATGEECRFKINLDGEITYKVHNYKSDGCIEHSEKILESIMEVYGDIKNKEVVWTENPNLNKKMFHNNIKKIGG